MKMKSNKYIYFSFVGSWSDYTIVRENEFIELPSNFDDMKLASCLFINPLTALSFIKIIKEKGFNNTIHTAGASALGKIFTRLCKINKINLINVVRKY